MINDTSNLVGTWAMMKIRSSAISWIQVGHFVWDVPDFSCKDPSISSDWLVIPTAWETPRTVGPCECHRLWRLTFFMATNHQAINLPAACKAGRNWHTAGGNSYCSARQVNDRCASTNMYPSSDEYIQWVFNEKKIQPLDTSLTTINEEYIQTNQCR